MKKFNERISDTWESAFTSGVEQEGKFLSTVSETESASRWIPGVQAKELSLTPLDTPMEVTEKLASMKLDEDIVEDTFTAGTKMVVSYGDSHWCISENARGRLYGTAGLQGPALGRMDVSVLTDVLQEGLNVAKGDTQLLERYGKIHSMHGDNYCVMPIPMLLQIAKREITNTFGEAAFKRGNHSAAYTSAIWTLPKFQQQFIKIYESAIKGASIYHVDWMPAVKVSSSDTSESSALIAPGFLTTGGVFLTFVEPYKVRHEKRASAEYGVDAFEQNAKAIYSKMQDMTKKIEELGKINIAHPMNCFIGICNWLNKAGVRIPKKYIGEAVDELEINLSINPVLSAHDIYIILSMIVSTATSLGASATVINTIEEGLTRVLNADWASLDIGGTVAWA